MAYRERAARVQWIEPSWSFRSSLGLLKSRSYMALSLESWSGRSRHERPEVVNQFGATQAHANSCEPAALKRSGLHTVLAHAGAWAEARSRGARTEKNPKVRRLPPCSSLHFSPYLGLYSASASCVMCRISWQPGRGAGDRGWGVLHKRTCTTWW